MKQCTDFLEVMKPMLDGIVAGDGHITPLKGKNSSCSLILGVGPKQEAFAKELANRLKEFGFEGNARVYDKQVRVVWLSKMFNSQRERWYPNDKKKVPLDISNTPEMWRWLYAGDGSLYICSTYGAKITIHVQGFELEDINKLASMLKEYNIDSWSMKDIISKVTGKRLYTLQIATKDTEKFLQLTSPPVSGLEYKWIIPKRELRICKVCDTSFLPKRSDMEYCSRKCGVKASHPFYQNNKQTYAEYRRKVNIQERKRRSLKPGYMAQKKYRNIT